MYLVINMPELLAPAGDYTSLIAAISNGADAIYLGLESMSARAYAKNFSLEELKEAVKYAHLRNVKIYVTMNTIIYESELDDAFLLANQAYLAGVDGLIIQDLALIKYTSDNFIDMEAHASTQVGIDDLNGLKMLEHLGVKRVVLARECSIDDINFFKANTSMSLEVFIHGALCVSYSGGCLMSGLIGMRSGNRGRCVGPCRKKYKLLCDGKVISDSYILSMKDLNTSKYVNELRNIDSLKIEGRMKNPEYIAGVVNLYRSILDKKTPNSMIEKTFNRTFTKGYLFNEDRKDITNVNKPNNNGFYIGKITCIKNGKYGIKLESILNQGDQIRIEAKDEVSLPIVKLYDEKDNLISSSTSFCFVYMKEKAQIGDFVYKTKDIKYIDEMNKTYPKEFKRLPLEIFICGKKNNPLVVTMSYLDYYVTIKSEILEEAKKQPLSKETIINQFSKINNTPYYISKIDLDISNDFFLPVKDLNELRRRAIEELDSKRLKERKLPEIKNYFDKISYDKKAPKLAVFVTNDEQYQAALDMHIDIIYYKNYSRRNNSKYPNVNDYVLIGNYGGIVNYKGNVLIADHTFNASNSNSIYHLHKMGVYRVTLPHEINSKEIKNLYNSYFNKNNGAPNLEMIVYGHQELMYTKYCPLKKNNLCGQCKKKQYYLDDGMFNFIIQNDNDCHTSILNGKILNLIDNLYDLQNYINVFRLQFTVETAKEVKDIISMFDKKLKKIDNKEKLFNEKTDTRGHYNRELI